MTSKLMLAKCPKGHYLYLANKNNQERKVTIKELAEFFKVHPRTVHKWDSKKRHQKTTQALAGAEPQITNLIGEINQLAYVFDCQNLQGVQQVKWCHVSRTTFMVRTTIFGVDSILFESYINLNAPDALPRLLVLKKYLMEMVYGGEK